jgi:hypothetical protein
VPSWIQLTYSAKIEKPRPAAYSDNPGFPCHSFN